MIIWRGVFLCTGVGGWLEEVRKSHLGGMKETYEKEIKTSNVWKI